MILSIALLPSVILRFLQKFPEGYWQEQTLDEGRRVQLSKRWGYFNHQDEDISLSKF